MRIFVTGSTGFIGSAIVQELINAGYQVIGLARSDAGAKSLTAIGVQVHRGELEDLESLRSGAAMSDGVIHTAFNHDFSKYKANCETDRRVIEALGSALAGSTRPLIVTSGTLITPGRLATEEDAPTLTSNDVPRMATEEAALSVAERGVNIMVMRLSPSVHGEGDRGFIPTLINIAREKGVSAFVGDGLNRWPAVHRLDAARLYKLALEKGSAGFRYHGVAEEGIAFRDIAEGIGRHLNIPIATKSPEEAAIHFGEFAAFVQLDVAASSKLTQQWLGWCPVQAGLIADLDHYFAT